MTTRIVLVRHAQSVPPRFGVPDDDQRPLTPAGVEAAKALAGRLAAYEPAAVLSSPQLRAVQTVTPAAGALGLAVTTWPEGAGTAAERGLGKPWRAWPRSTRT